MPRKQQKSTPKSTKAPAGTVRAVAGIIALGKRAGSAAVADSIGLSPRHARRVLKQAIAGKLSDKQARILARLWSVREQPVATSKPYEPAPASRPKRIVSAETRQRISEGVKAYYERKRNYAAAPVVRDMLAAGARVLSKPETWSKKHHILRVPGSTLQDAAQKLSDSGLVAFSDFHRTPEGKYQIVVWDETNAGKRKGKKAEDAGGDGGGDGGGGGGGDQLITRTYTRAGDDGKAETIVVTARASDFETSDYEEYQDWDYEDIEVDDADDSDYKDVGAQ